MIEDVDKWCFAPINRHRLQRHSTASIRLSEYLTDHTCRSGKPNHQRARSPSKGEHPCPHTACTTPLCSRRTWRNSTSPPTASRNRAHAPDTPTSRAQNAHNDTRTTNERCTWRRPPPSQTRTSKNSKRCDGGTDSHTDSPQKDSVPLPGTCGRGMRIDILAIASEGAI